MSTLPQNQTRAEREWRDAVVEAEKSRQEFEQKLRKDDGEGDERAIGRLWLRLWRAERRRDELLRRSD